MTQSHWKVSFCCESKDSSQGGERPSLSTVGGAREYGRDRMEAQDLVRERKISQLQDLILCTHKSPEAICEVGGKGLTSLAAGRVSSPSPPISPLHRGCAPQQLLEYTRRNSLGSPRRKSALFAPQLAGISNRAVERWC